MRLYLENKKYCIFHFLIYGRVWIVLQSYGKVRSVRPSPEATGQGQKMGQKVKWRNCPRRTKQSPEMHCR